MNNEKTGQTRLYSIRMHASSDKGHLCGAERVVHKELIHVVSSAMVNRAMKRGGQGLASINISVDAVESGSIRKISLLPIQSVNTENPQRAEEEALGFLAGAGVSKYAARRALKAIASGASSKGGNMRGSMIVHAKTGDRLEPDPERGVRVSRMDLTSEAREGVWKLLDKRHMRHPRVLEAVILASKVAAIPGIVAEICRSDDPDYTTGYVASPKLGYVRLLNIKASGDLFGGRVFFVDGEESLEGMIHEMEQVPYLISELGESLTG